MGVTRGCVLTLARDLGMEAREQDMRRKMPYLPDEIFSTGAAVKILPVWPVDKVTVDDGKRGPITVRIEDACHGILRGRASDRHGWLTPVDS
jgi:branched-chain amino acid aminotransferase